MGMFRKHLLATVLVGISATGWARVNSLEPWAPGFDANVSSQKWNHAVFAHVANSGAYGADTTGLGYSLTTPLWKKLGDWLGPGASKPWTRTGCYDDSGPTDLTFGFKRKLPQVVDGQINEGSG
jgi:hypothetical protein